MTVLKFTVPEEWDNCRLRDFLKTAHNISGTTIKRARQTELGLTMDGKHIRTIDAVKAGSEIAVIVTDEDREYRKSGVSVDLLYLDDDVAVLDKPFDMPCHPSLGHPYDSLANAFASLDKMEGKTFRPVGRLDKDTSGAVVCALHAHSAYFLTENRPEKTYFAIVSPPPVVDSGDIEAPIARESEDSIKRHVSPDGQYALTHYKTIIKNEKYALLKVKIATGRTHQIRVHMSYIGSPLIGDELYGGNTEIFSRHALHCEHVDFIQPITGEKISVPSPIPNDMKDFLTSYLEYKEDSFELEDKI